MLKYLWLIAVVLLASCTPSKKEEKSAVPEIKLEREVADDVPQFVRDAVKNAPNDALVGIGNAKSPSFNMARTLAATRARAEIARQLDKVTTEIVRNYSVSSKADPADEVVFRETITVSLSKANLSGVKTIDEDIDDEGVFWVVVTMEKSNLIEQLSGVQEEAKTAVPSMASFNAEELINASIK